MLYQLLEEEDRMSEILQSALDYAGSLREQAAVSLPLIVSTRDGYYVNLQS